MPAGKDWLIVAFGEQTKQDAGDQALALMAHLKKQKNAPSMELYDDEPQEHQIWEVRESALGGSSFVPGKKPAWPGWEDSAVPPIRKAHTSETWTRFSPDMDGSHQSLNISAKGCIHIRVPFELTTQLGLDSFSSFMNEATSLIVSYGGSSPESTGMDKRELNFFQSYLETSWSRLFVNLKLSGIQIAR